LQQRNFSEAVVLYKQMISTELAADQIYLVSRKWSEDPALLDDFYNACIDSLGDPKLKDMINSVSRSIDIYRPSKFWIFYATYHALQIEIWGIANFKRTVNNGYFNWTDSGTIANHIHYIKRDLGQTEHRLNSRKASWKLEDKPAKFNDKHWKEYAELLCLLFDYSSKHDSHKLFSLVEESSFGNPVGVTYNNHYVTQDICNSILDVNFILENTNIVTSNPLRIMELGAGHGRIMHTILKAFSHMQVIIVDIPPALYVSQWYLTNTFPELKSFNFREFLNYSEIKTEFESSSISFLTPEQIELIPNNSIDLFINISSLHEMTPVQINNWFNQIGRVTNGWFYTKQFKKYPNLIDNLIIREEDYPVHPEWKEKVRRTNPIFQEFFEVVYKI